MCTCSLVVVVVVVVVQVLVLLVICMSRTGLVKLQRHEQVPVASTGEGPVLGLCAQALLVVPVLVQGVDGLMVMVMQGSLVDCEGGLEASFPDEMGPQFGQCCEPRQ